MSGKPFKLAGEFPGATKDDWLKLVDKVLKGASFDDVLVTETYDNIKINPLYDSASLENHAADPGCYPYTRATTELANTQDGWTIAQRYAHPSVEENNTHVLEDLNRGVTEITLQFSDLARLGNSSISASNGDNGIECYSVAALGKIFKNVQLDLVPVQLDAGNSWFKAGAGLIALWENNGVAKESAKANLNADPAASLVQSGELNCSKERSLEQLASLAKFCVANYPNVKSIGVSTTPYHNAGASHSQEIAIALATGVSYLRAMTDAGIDIDSACGQIHFTISCDTDYFQNIAKLRSLRQCWAQVCNACGAKPEHAQISLSAETSQRMLSQRDPWVNVLRGTIASCAAAIGSATSITTACYDGAIGLPSNLSRRISRNTQLLLQDECSIHKIVDPAGGSYFMENHTNELGVQAWKEFQAIEADGGIFSVLIDGTLQTSIEAVRKVRSYNIGGRKDPLTGVSEFANLSEEPIETAQVDRAAIRKTALTNLSNTDSKGNTEIQALITQLQNGDSFLDSKEIANPCTANALVMHRDAAEFENLRDAADRYKKRTNKNPSVYLVNIGTPAQYNARAGFVTNFFASGGIHCINDASSSSALEASKNWASSNCSCAVLCSTDRLIEEKGEAIVTALRDAGVEHIFIAGNSLKDSCDTQLTLKSHALEVLQQTHQLLKVS